MFCSLQTADRTFGAKELLSTRAIALRHWRWRIEFASPGKARRPTSFNSPSYASEALDLANFFAEFESREKDRPLAAWSAFHSALRTDYRLNVLQVLARFELRPDPRQQLSFANLRMSADFGFSDRVYGFGSGIFFRRAR